MKGILRLSGALALAICLLLSIAAQGQAEAVSHTARLTAEKNQVLTGEMVVLRVSAPGAEELALYREINGESAVFEQVMGPDEYETYDFIREETAATYRLAARFGEEWVNSAPLTVTASAPFGPMPAPDIRVDSPVRLGQSVSFTVGTVENGFVYSVSVTDDGGREVEGVSQREGAYTVPAGRLSNGLYHITAKAVCDGYTGIGTGTADFFVGTTGHTVTLSADRNSYLTHEKFTLALSAPEADRVVLYQYGSELAAWDHGVEESYETSFAYDGTVSYQLRALYGDEWAESPELKLEITAPYGGEPPFQVYARGVYEENQDVAISLSELQGVAEFGLTILGPTYEKVYETHTYGDIILPGDTLGSGYYHLNAYVRAEGYLFDAMVDLDFHVGAIDETIILAADREPLIWEPYGVRCYVPDTQEAILYEVDPDSGSLYELKHWFGAVDETVERYAFGSIDGASGYLLAARFGEAWKEKGLVVRPSAPYGDAPEITIGTQEQYAEGQDIAIPIQANGRLVTCYINILDAAGNWLRGLEGYDEAAQVYTIPAGELLPGRYQIEVTAIAMGFAEQTIKTADFRIGDGGRTLILTATPEHPVTGGLYTVRMGAPYADEMWLYRRDGEGEEYVFFNWIPGAIRDLDAGAGGEWISTYRLTARFGEEWVEAPLLTVHYDTPNGVMPDPVIHAQSQYAEGEPASFTVDTVEGTFLLEVSVYNAAGDRVYFEDYWDYREFQVHESLLAPGSYTIQVRAQAKGYGGTGQAQASFTVGGGEAPAKPAIAGTAFEGGVLSGRVIGVEEGQDVQVRVTFYITGNYYMSTSAMLETDGAFEVEGVGPIEYITVLAYGEGAGGGETRYAVAELYVE